MEWKTDLYNLCFTCLLDSTNESRPTTEAEAAYNLDCWKKEGDPDILRIISGLSISDFVAAWNDVYSYLNNGKGI